MHIDVRVATSGLDEQTRAYAEFRMFSALARLEPEIDAVTVVLTRASISPGSIDCAVSVTFADGGRLRVRARGSHAYDAINRAVLRVSHLVPEHPAAVSS